MKLTLACFFAALSLGAANASTIYYGGFEDTPTGDRDYQDVVFSLSSASNSLGLFVNFSSTPTGLVGPTVTGGHNGDGTPYWNNISSDPTNPPGGPNPDIGSCLYQGCTTNLGIVNAAPSPSTLDYYSTSAPTSIYFTDKGADSISILANITADTDAVGYAVCDNAFCTSGVQSPVLFSGSGSFMPCGANPNAMCSFELVGDVNHSPTYDYSVTSGFQSFAVFADDPAPEPASFGLIGIGLSALAFYGRKLRG